MNNASFGSGCSIHIDYTARSLDELTEVCQILQQYQGVVCHAEVKTNGGNGDKENGSKKEELDRLMVIAKSKGVYLVKKLKAMFSKSPSECSMAELKEFGEWLDKK